MSSTGNVPETGVTPCVDISVGSAQLPEREAIANEAEVHHFTTRSYEWVVEGDIKACFDEISHSALMERVLFSEQKHLIACTTAEADAASWRDTRVRLGRMAMARRSVRAAGPAL